MMSERSMLPPRLRNWKKGTVQVGVFLRMRDGATVTTVNDKASEDQEALACALAVGNLPETIMADVRAWYVQRTKP